MEQPKRMPPQPPPTRKTIKPTPVEELKRRLQIRAWEPDIARQHRESHVFRAVTKYADDNPGEFSEMSFDQIYERLIQIEQAASMVAIALYPIDEE